MTLFNFFKWLQQRRDIHLRILNLESSMNHHQQLLPSGAAGDNSGLYALDMERRRGVVVATTTTLAVFIGLAVALHCRRRRRRRRRRREEKETLPPPAPAPAPVVRSTVYETVPTPALLRRHPTYGPFGDSDVTTFAGEPGGTFKIVYLVRHAQAEHNVQEKIAEEEVLAAGGTKEEAERARKAAIDQEHLRDAPLSVKGAAQVVDRAGVRLHLS